MTSKSSGLLVIFALMLALAFSAQAEELNLDFELVNKTGYDIQEIYLAPSASDNWGENILKEEVGDGDTVEISFASEATAKQWDLKIVWSEGGDAVVWKGYNLTEISKLTLKYDKENDETSALSE